ncbi:MAG: signal peptide peptidase SppA [Deltaproteobacteria bacterium]|nr:MAG: signal peptide peptidase SppA [Deltaproteobacteria bacterium]
MAVVANPAGLRFLRGRHVGLLLHVDDDAEATSAGAGYGGYASAGVQSRLVPPMGIGVGLEVLRPARAALLPDPGEPVRLSLGSALPIGDAAAFGATYHRFFDSGGPLDGVTTWDLGLAARMGPRFAAGFVVRDVGRPSVDGVPVQRRYEVEVATRPTGTDRVELALGGRFGETRLDIDGWLRGSVRVARGVWLRSELVAQRLNRVTATPGGEVDDGVYEARVTAGVELSFGRTGALGTGTFAGNLDGGDAHPLAASVYLRVSDEQRPPVLGERERIAKFEIGGALSERALTATVSALRDAARDDAVRAVFVHVDDVQVGWSGARTLRRALQRVREAGKPVLAYIVAGNTRDYYIASAADKVWVDPAGGIRLTGFAATVLYFKELLARVGAEAQFERIEEFKTAPEAFTRTGPSQPALAMRESLYDDLYATIAEDIARSRGIAPARVRELIDGGPYTAGQLADLPELVDGVVEPDKLGDAVRAALGRSLPFGPRPLRASDRWHHPTIAVIYVDGDIVSGRSRWIPLLGRRLAGSETLAAAIAGARADRDVSAIVVRVDSPGGDALASEVIAREVKKTRGVKPIVCSLGDVAASGGYFIAAGCDRIFAEPTTITGSIGIFVGKVDLSGLLSRLGITWHTYKRGRAADRDSYFRPYTDDERRAVKRQIRYYYGRFVDFVAGNRGLTPEQVDDVGRGRVWTGRQAVDVGLVDELGGIGDAIAHAKRAAGIPDGVPAQLRDLPDTPLGLLNRLLGAPALGRGDAGALAPGVREVLRALPASMWAESGRAHGRPQARLPFDIVWD